MEQKIKRFWEANKRALVCCLLAVFVWGLAAHAYQFLNFQLSHDSLDGLYAAAGENEHKIELGRVFAPAYRYVVRGMFAAPWLTGFLALVWIGLAAFLLVRIFDVQSRVLMTLICGVMAVNLTVTALSATYLHDLDINMFGMFMACLAACLWRQKTRGWPVLGALAVGVSMGMYQSYVSMTIALVMMVLILDLMNGQKPRAAIHRGAGAAAMVLLGGAVYFAGVRLISSGAEVELAQRSNSVTQLGNLSFSQLPALVGGAYENWWDFFAVPHSTWLSAEAALIVNLAFLALIAGALVWILVRKDLSAGAKALIALIALLLPLGMNVCYILTSGGVHDLMKYAFALAYVLALLLSARLPVRPVRWACGALTCLLLWSGVQTANNIYLKKTAIWNATYSSMNNVVYDMLYYGYIPGETEVFISGAIPYGGYEGFEEVEDVIGVGHNNAVTNDVKSIKMYFQYVLGDPLVFATEEQQEAIMQNEEFEWMSRYPDEGYITIIDDVMVVKLS